MLPTKELPIEKRIQSTDLQIRLCFNRKLCPNPFHNGYIDQIITMYTLNTLQFYF